MRTYLETGLDAATRAALGYVNAKTFKALCGRYLTDKKAEVASIGPLARRWVAFPAQLQARRGGRMRRSRSGAAACRALRALLPDCCSCNPTLRRCTRAAPPSQAALESGRVGLTAHGLEYHSSKAVRRLYNRENKARTTRS